jgi:hypothetical protein
MIIKKDHLTRMALTSAAVLNLPKVGNILCNVSTTGAVTLKIVCDMGLKKSAWTNCSNSLTNSTVA